MIIIKAGGSVITKKNGFMQVDKKNIILIANLIQKLWKNGEKILLVHGAGSFGHPYAKKYSLKGKLTSKRQKIGFATTHYSCNLLSDYLLKELVNRDIAAISIPPSAIIEQKNGKIQKTSNFIEQYLEAGFLPVLYGDMTLDNNLIGAVCSGDKIISYFAKKLKPKKIVLITDVEGVLDDKNKVIKKITQKNFSEISKYLYNRKGDVTGSMRGKIEELLSLDSTSYIVSYKKCSQIPDLIKGKKEFGTRIN